MCLCACVRLYMRSSVRAYVHIFLRVCVFVSVCLIHYAIIIINKTSKKNV